MRWGRQQTGSCPICKKCYTQENQKSHHHILPKRFFNGIGEQKELCRNCHNKLERLIPRNVQLSEREYYRIYFKFEASHCAKKFKRKPHWRKVA